jgi:tetratricopeptide (TPR) repeat protein
MKCIYCGEEITEGSLYCSHCGKAVQIVPDYNVYDDDYLKQVLAEENGVISAGKEEKGTNGSQGKGGNQQKKSKKKIIIRVAAIVVFLAVILIVLGAAVRSNHNNSFSYQVEQAEKAVANGNIDKAIEYYENALALDQSSIDVRLALAELYLEKNDSDSALVLYQEVLKLDNKNREACENLIAIYDERGNTDAIIALGEAVDDSLSDLFDEYSVTAPEFDLEEGTFDEVQKLTLSSEDGYDIYYTLDGGDPSEKGVRYTEPIELEENNKTYTVMAVCVNSKKIYSEVITKEYTIELAPPDMPIVTPDGGDFGVETTVTVTVPDGCTAYYTWSGATPSESSKRYSGPIAIPEGNNVLSVILVDNTTGLRSEVYRGNYVYYDEDYTDENVEGEQE